MSDLALERPSSPAATSSTRAATRAAATLAAAPSVALLLKQAEQRVREVVRPALDEHGLSLEHWRILAVLHDQPGLPMSPLAEAAVVPAATLTRHVDKLVELGLVVRRVDPVDRRRAVTALAPRGTAYVRRLRDLERLAESEILAQLFPSGNS